MPKRSKLLLSGLVWVAAFFRYDALFANHFHVDEALFASYARLIATWRDPLLAAQNVDKPPLLFYLQALFFPLMGPVEWAARLPGFIASVLLVPLVALFAWRLYREAETSVLAAVLITLSPVAIQYSATAFTDPLLVSLLLLSLLLASGKSYPVLSGLFLGFAVVTKFQAWLFVPILIGITRLQEWTWQQWRRWLAGFLTTLLALVLWEVARSGGPVLWSNQIGNFGGVRAVWSWEVGPRLSAWAGTLQMAFGLPILVGLALLTFVILWVRANRKRDNAGSIDIMLILALLAYLIIHWLIAVPIWDRYLLLLAPLFSILLARAITVLWKWSEEWSGRYQKRWKRIALQVAVSLTLPGLILLGLIPNAVRARSGQWPIGGQSTADQGAWQVANYLANEPYGTVLYDHWYSWQWQYHLFDKGVYVSWFPHPDALAEDLDAFGDSGGDRYLILPASEAARPVKRAIATTDFQLHQVLLTDYEPGMLLYRIEKQEDR
jgi:4-amino-4-deoxy-L-arabinose transferase-like glycosyltransferase